LFFQVLELSQEVREFPWNWLLIRRGQRSERELSKSFRNPWAIVPDFQRSDLFRLHNLARLVLKARFEFVGEQAAGEKPVQCLGTSLRAANADPGWPMPQFDSRLLEEMLFDVSFRTTKGNQPFAQGFRLFL
jgi:hypothetical protein